MKIASIARERAHMPESIDWTVTTYEGNRRRQHEEFRAISFGEKLARVTRWRTSSFDLGSGTPAAGFVYTR